MKVIEAVKKLSSLGYRFELAGDRLRYRYEGQGDPDRGMVLRLLEVVKAHKPDVLTYLSKSSPPATCESCPWHALNPWTHYPDFAAWCLYRMEPLAAASPACKEFSRGEVPARHPHKQVPIVPAAAYPANAENAITCADCPHFQPNNGRNLRQGWGWCLKRNKGRFGCATACAAAPTVSQK